MRVDSAGFDFSPKVKSLFSLDSSGWPGLTIGKQLPSRSANGRVPSGWPSSGDSARLMSPKESQRYLPGRRRSRGTQRISKISQNVFIDSRGISASPVLFSGISAILLPASNSRDLQALALTVFSTSQMPLRGRYRSMECVQDCVAFGKQPQGESARRVAPQTWKKVYQGRKTSRFCWSRFGDVTLLIYMFS